MTKPPQQEPETKSDGSIDWVRVLAFVMGLPGLAMGGTAMLSALEPRSFEHQAPQVIALLAGLAIFSVGILFSGSAAGLFGKRTTSALMTLAGLLFWFLVHWVAIYGTSKGVSIGPLFVQSDSRYLGYLGLAVLDGIVIYVLADTWFGPRLPRWAAVSETNSNKNRGQLMVLVILFFTLLAGAEKLELYGR